jgi:hypothetical protein
MNESPVQDEAPAAVPRRSRLRWILLGIVLVVAAIVGVFAYVIHEQDRELREAIAEADRLDPGWRFEDLQAARENVPDAENGAVFVLAARGKIPARWLAPPAGELTLDMRLAAGPPPQRPNEADLKELREELAKAEIRQATEIARQLADRRRGRYTVAWKSDGIGTMVPHIGDVREVVRLLVLDARWRALNGDVEGALLSCRAALNASRSIGDEPITLSQLTRAGCASQMVRALEHVLAQGEAPATALEQLQRCVAEEAEEPLELTAARSDRVVFYQFFEVVRTGRFDRASYGLAPSKFGARGDDLMDRGKARAGEAAYLRYYNQVVEALKLPTEAQQEALGNVREPDVPLPKLLEALSRGTGEKGWGWIAKRFHLATAELRCATAALAAERYRLATGHWPNSLDVLVPKYLSAVPVDPFDGQPLRLKHLPEGLVVYSIGPDKRDDGDPIDRDAPGAQVRIARFQLWNVDLRGKK